MANIGRNEAFPCGSGKLANIHIDQQSDRVS